MVVVSEFILNISYSLNKDITLEKIGEGIEKLCRKISQDELKGMVLVISLQKIVDYAGDSLVPKIEYDESVSN